MADTAVADLVAWGAVTRCRPGEDTAGDMALVEPVGDGVLVAAVDGSGHGLEASRAARTAVEVLSRFDGGDLAVLAEACHRALGGSRGAAMSIAFLSAVSGTMTWLAVGNVEGRLVPAARSAPPPAAVALRLPGGVSGHHLPPLHPVTLPLGPGDVLVLATDGVRPAFADRLLLTGTPQAIADRIVAEHWNATDDALALVVRYRGAAA